MTSRSVAMEGLHLAAPLLEFVIGKFPAHFARALPIATEMLNSGTNGRPRGVKRIRRLEGPCSLHGRPSDPAALEIPSAQHRRVLAKGAVALLVRTS